MKKLSLKLVLVFISLLAVSCGSGSSLEITALQCEKLNDPLGIDTTSPHFSWHLDSEVQGAAQTAYQIVVASNEKLLSEEKADLWNSGKMASESSNWVLYRGDALKPGSFSYWKVRVWDQKGKFRHGANRPVSVLVC